MLSVVGVTLGWRSSPLLRAHPAEGLGLAGCLWPGLLPLWFGAHSRSWNWLGLLPAPRGLSPLNVCPVVTGVITRRVCRNGPWNSSGSKEEKRLWDR